MLMTIQLTGADQLTAAWNQAPELAGQDLSRFMHAATLYLEGEVQERTPAAHGTLKTSWTNDVDGAGMNVIGIVGTPLAYAVPVELGTKPHFPPVDALLDWVKIRFGVPEAEARNIAFLVARKIASKGTEGAFMLERALDAAEPELDRRFAQLLDGLASRLAPGGKA
jgi:hypothetical protein